MKQKDLIKELDVVFSKDLLEGLSSNPKTLSSKYFYDETGDRLFQQIMQLDEYYLTRAEYRILEKNARELTTLLLALNSEIQLIEFGAGDGYKTKLLLTDFIKNKLNFTYVPIDISENAIKKLSDDISILYPNLIIKPVEGEYFEALKLLQKDLENTKLVMFLGSNIGNFKELDSLIFLKKLHASLTKNDRLLIGFDLMKKPQKIMAAYNDSEGVTKKFNLNLLKRINEEFDADFDLNTFEHYPVYNPQTGEMKSFLVSNKKQTVHFSALDRSIDFEKWEAIQTEVSQKFNLEKVYELAQKAGFEIERNFIDDEDFYLNSLWKVV